MPKELEIRECTTIEDFEECVRIQREVFALPEQELSPVRHFVVTKNAGGFTLGAFDGDRMAAFVLSVPAFLRGEQGIGARLKWEQRERALALGVRYLKWTFEPVKARNAFFNLEKLGATVAEYEVNFYGTDYGTSSGVGLASDRLFAEWDLSSAKVEALAAGSAWNDEGSPAAEIGIMNDWFELVERDPEGALQEQIRIRGEFTRAFESGLIGRGFRRGEEPSYLLYKR
jgi:predicted GNAT superfamily acetyltransferase